MKSLPKSRHDAKVFVVVVVVVVIIIIIIIITVIHYNDQVLYTEIV
jgi:hypothetical protein